MTIESIVAGLYEKYKDPQGVDYAIFANSIQEDARDQGVLVDVIFPQANVIVIVPRRFTPAEAVQILGTLTDDESAHLAADQVLLWQAPFEVQDAYNAVMEANLEDWA